MRRIFILLLLITTVGNAQVLNEICPSNSGVLEHETAGYPDWVELYNPYAFAIPLHGFTLSNDIEEPAKWTFPAASIAPGEYLVIYADEEVLNTGIVSFNFKREGFTLYLFNSEGEVVDSLVQPYLEKNHSFGKQDGRTYYYQTPSPGEVNTVSTGYNGYASKPQFGVPAGAATAPSVVIYPMVEGQAIYYSLNGTAPADGQLYESAIPMEETICVKAICRGDSLIDSAPVYRTYFSNIKHGLPIVNLTVDSLDLFDEEEGIHMLGDGDDSWPYWGANFWEDQKLDAYFEYFDAEMGFIEGVNCRMRIHGGIGSRIRPMKSFAIEAVGPEKETLFDQYYFSEKDIAGFKRLLLRNSGNDFSNTFFKDALIQEWALKNDLDIDLQAYNPVVVYINGNYWGMMNMREKVDRYYVASNYDVDPETVNILEGKLLTVVSGSGDSFMELLAYVGGHDLTTAEHYDWVGEQLDISSFVDYFILQLFINNRDWPNNNLKLWNSEEHAQWRYLCYDLDGGFKYWGDSEEDMNSLAFVLNEHGVSNPHVFLLSRLLTNAKFKRYFINRYADLVNTIFKKDGLSEYILAKRNYLMPEMQRHYEKWCGPLFTWLVHVDQLLVFLEDRTRIVREDIENVFNKRQEGITVTTYPSDVGAVQLNTVQITEFPFSGVYYQDNAIELSIDPNQKKEFLFWENMKTREKYYHPSIQVVPEEGDHFVATFENGDNRFDLSTFPNPVQTITTLDFSIPTSANVFIGVHKMNGDLIGSSSREKYMTKGTYSVAMDLSDLPKGTYIVSLVTSYGREAIQVIKQ